MVVYPFAATSKSGVSDGTDHTGTVGVYGEAIVALFTDSDITIEDFAVCVDFAADTVFIEDVTGGAFCAEAIDPGFASEVIVDVSHEIRILVFRRESCQSFWREYLREMVYLTASESHKQNNKEDLRHCLMLNKKYSQRKSERENSAVG